MVLEYDLAALIHSNVDWMMICVGEGIEIADMKGLFERISNENTVTKIYTAFVHESDWRGKS